MNGVTTTITSNLGNKANPGLPSGGASALFFNGVLNAGTTTFIKQGSGTLITTAANTGTGQYLINAGVVNSQSTQSFGTSTTVTVVVASGATIQLENSGTAAVAKLLVLNGSGVTDSNGNSHGTLENLSGGANTWSGAITLASPSIINTDVGQLTLSGVISGNADLTKIGGGTLVLSTALNTYTGQTTIGTSTTTTSANTTISSGTTVTFANGQTTANLFVGMLVTGTTVPAGTTIAAINSTTSLTLSQAATNGSVSLTFAGNGGIVQVTSGGGNPTTSLGVVTGGVVVNSGSTLQLSPTALATYPGKQLTLNGNGMGLFLSGILTPIGALQNTSTFANTWTGNIILGSNTTISNTAAVSNVNALTLTGVISGAYNLAKVGVGTIELAAPETYTGTTTVSAGVLSLVSVGTLQTTSSITVNVNAGGSGATFQIDNINTLSSLVNTGTVAANIANRLYNGTTAIPIFLNGGNFNYLGYTAQAGVVSTETLGTVTLNSGASTIQTTTGTLLNDGVILTIAGLNRNVGATVNFAAGGTAGFNQPLGSTLNQINFTTPPTLTNGILPYATVQTLNNAALDLASYGSAQTITFSGNITGGTFVLSYNGVSTNAITWSSNYLTLASNIQAALNALTAINGNIAVSGSGPFTVNFLGALANSAQSPIAVVSTANLQGTSPTITTAITNNTGSIAAFANYKSSLASAGSTDNVRITAGETLVGNLNVNALLIVNTAAVGPTVQELNGTSNYTLTIGSGTVVVTNNNAAADTATISGGTVNFGSAEGIIISNNNTGVAADTTTLTVNSAITGTNGVTIAAGNTTTSSIVNLVGTDAATYTSPSAVQTISFPGSGSNTSAQTFTLSFNNPLTGTSTTVGPITWSTTLGTNTTANTLLGNIQTALNTALGSGNTVVSGTSLAAVAITFTGQLANMPLSVFTVSNSTLGGGTPTVATTTAGAYSTTFNGPGVLNVSSVSALGNGTVALTAGTFGTGVTTGLFYLGNAITLSNNAVVTLGTANTWTLTGSVTLNGADQVATNATATVLTTLGGTIGGSGSLNLIGAANSSLALTGANTYTGGTNLGGAGALIVANNNALGSGTLNLTGGIIESAAQLQSSAGATVFVASPGLATATIANPITLINSATTIGGVFGTTTTFTGNVTVAGATNTLNITHPGVPTGATTNQQVITFPNAGSNVSGTDTFTLNFNGISIGPITWNSTAATLVSNIQAAMDAALGAGKTLVAATPAQVGGVIQTYAGSVEITFLGSLATANIPLITVTASALTGGAPTVVEGQVQTLTFAGSGSNTNGQQFSLSFNGTTVGPITWSTTVSTLVSNIQAAMDTALGAGNTLVAGTSLASITVSFQNALGKNNMPLFVAGSSTLTGGAPTIALTGNGPASGLVAPGVFFNGVISGTGALTFAQSAAAATAGLVQLNGANTLTGGVTLTSSAIAGNNITVVVGNNSALGTGLVTLNASIAGAFAVLQDDGIAARTITNALVIASTTLGQDAINATNTSFNFTLSGNIGGALGATGVLEAGLPSLGGVVPSNSPGTVVLNTAETYAGGAAGTLFVNQGTLSLSGSGTVLNGAAFAGAITVNPGATLLLDNTTTNNVNRLSDTATVGITLNGGTFLYKGTNTAGALSAETLGNLTIGAGNSIINTVAGAGAGAAVNVAFGTYTRNAGGLVTFQAGTGAGGSQSLNTATNTVTITSDVATANNGIILGATVADGTTYANNNTGFNLATDSASASLFTIGAYTAATLLPTTATTATTNYIVNGTSVTIGQADSVNSLLLVNGATVAGAGPDRGHWNDPEHRCSSQHDFRERPQPCFDSGGGRKIHLERWLDLGRQCDRRGRL